MAGKAVGRHPLKPLQWRNIVHSIFLLINLSILFCMLGCSPILCLWFILNVLMHTPSRFVRSFYLSIIFIFYLSINFSFSIYDTYSFQVIPVMGKVIAGDLNSYKYLVESIRKFPNQVSYELTCSLDFKFCFNKGFKMI